MTVRKILLYPEDNHLLRKKSTKVARLDSQTRKLAQDLKDTLIANPGAGLAAPQVGVYRRVVAVKFGQDEGEMKSPLILVNPRIVEAGELSRGFDGCLSIPDLFTWETLRPSWLSFSALGENGEKIEMRVSGIDARLVHHEIDHLEGILFIDRIRSITDLYQKVETEGGEKFVRLDLGFKAT